MYLAVDIGGTKTLLAILDNEGRVTQQLKFPTPTEYAEFLDVLATSVKKLQPNNFHKSCVAIPGKVDRENGVGIAFGNLAWTDVPIQTDCEKLLHCPVIIENDANLAGLSEAILLGSSYHKVLYVTISTGIGGGFVVDGKLDTDFLDSEIGQTMLEHNGHFKRWEDFASGRAIVEKFGKKASEIDDQQIWYKVSRNIAVGLINVIAILTPDAIILGGGVGSHYEKFKDRLDEELKIYENPLLKVPPIFQAQRPEEAVIYGCYELAKTHHENIKLAD